MDAPSRGHDLKLASTIPSGWTHSDAPSRPIVAAAEAPSRGHDLKLDVDQGDSNRGFDAPSRGHDLKPL